jgi:uncharacterized membrane protein (UPF0127 family)
MRPIALVLGLVLSLAGCSSQEAMTVRVGGQPWTVLDGDADGMRGKTDFGGADGMLFAFDPDVDTSGIVWVMDGVAFPLDIAWFDAEGRLLDTTTMPVCPTQPCPTYAPEADRPYRYALEAPVGAFDPLEPDDRLELTD